MGFDCDRQAKNDFTASTYAYLTMMYPKYNVKYFEADADGDLVPYGTWQASLTAPLDVYIELYNDTTDIVYSVEIKERWGNYTSTSYGNPGQEGWMYNPPKDEKLQRERKEGRIPLFCNLYPDGLLTIWRVDNVNREDILLKDIRKINIDPNSRTCKQKRYQLWNKDGKTIKRIKG